MASYLSDNSMQYFNWLKKLTYLSERTAFEEKHSELTSEDMLIMKGEDWQVFSIHRGYSPEEISIFKDFIDTVEYGVNTFGLSFGHIQGLVYNTEQLPYDTLWQSGNHPIQLGYTFDDFKDSHPDLFKHLII